jgi:GntR family transcriptional regulator
MSVYSRLHTKATNVATFGGTKRAVARQGARSVEGAAPAALPPFAGDRTGAAPLYRQIAEHIQQALAANESLVGTRLPAEESLAAAFAVTRVTLRRAIQELVRRGLVVPVHGRGTYFTEHRVIEQPLASSLISFSEALRALGIAYTTRLVSRDTIVAPPALARRLATTGAVHAVRRLRFVEGKPVILLDNYVPAALFPDLLARDLEANQLFATLTEHYGMPPFDGIRTFEATLAHGETAGLLEIATGDPVMYAEQTTRRADGTPIEASNMWIPGRRFKLHAHIFREPDGNARPHPGRR